MPVWARDFVFQYGLNRPKEFKDYYKSIDVLLSRSPIYAKRAHVRTKTPQASKGRVLTTLPFEEKVHNILNQAVIKKIAPELLEFPMAATLLSAKHPIILQEASRAARKILEGLKWKAHRMSKGLISEPRLGWVNFQFLSNNNNLYDVIDFLTQPYWDKKRMQVNLRKLSHTSLHPTSDMLMKILTIDHCLDV